MTVLLHELLLHRADKTPSAIALRHRDKTCDYATLVEQVEQFATGLLGLGLQRNDRVAIFLPKQIETVVAIFGALRAGLVFVPINPILKPAQVEHILRDCNVRLLVTSAERHQALQESLSRCEDVQNVALLSADIQEHSSTTKPRTLSWSQLLSTRASQLPHRVIDADMAAILYTSGSTGRPKGVVLSHRNMVTGALSVADYLENTADDRLLAVLPFSFDYGFSQLSTAFAVGASVILMEYLFPKDILALAAREHATGLAGVPPLWSQLADLEWPAEVRSHLRYITNSGGAMPIATLQKLRRSLPQTKPFLMYGLTEAFRSTYLPPSEIDRRVGSMGKAIPNAEILVVRPDGTQCSPGEPGELVHRGSLVALGYWNDAEKTAERFKPTPAGPAGLMLTEMAVWSGDTVKTDQDGYLYFVGRRDEMIKTSGYRVSPSEIEEVLFATGLIADAAAVGMPHPTLGQAVAVVVTPAAGRQADTDALLLACRKSLPAFMVPMLVDWRAHLPRNPNGKYDRARLTVELSTRLLEPPQ